MPGIVTVQLGEDLRRELLQRVATFEDDVDDVGVDGELVLARGIEQGFEFVSESLNRQEIQKARAAFERMERAEDRVERVGVRRIVLKN